MGKGAINKLIDVQKRLSKALRGVDKRYSDLIIDPMTEVRPVDAPFLNRSVIYRVEHLGRRRPTLFYVGFTPGKRTFLLTDIPENYVKLARADNVVIEAPSMAGDYAASYLEVTRTTTKLFYLVRSIDDVMVRPNLDEVDARQAASFIEEYAPVITAPSAVSADGGFVVSIYAVREHALELHTINVSRDGEIGSEVATLERDLPLVYGL